MRRLNKPVQINSNNHDLEVDYFRACKEYEKNEKWTTWTESEFFQNTYS